MDKTMTKLTPIQRKIVRRARHEIIDNGCDCLCAFVLARWDACPFAKPQPELDKKFREFYNIWDCPFEDHPDSEELRTTRILLLEFFLILDGVIE